MGKKNKNEKINPVMLTYAKAYFAAAVVVVLIIVTFNMFYLIRRPGSLAGLFEGEFASSEFQRAAFYSSESSFELESYSPRTKFKIDEPIMFAIVYRHTANANDKLTWQITKKGDDRTSENVVRQAEFPMYWKGDVATNQDVTKYIPIATKNVHLDAGNYTITLKDEESEIMVRHFTVSADRADATI